MYHIVIYSMSFEFKFLAGVRRCGSRILSRGAQLSKPKVADVAKRSRASGANH